MATSSILLEVCIASLDDATAAASAGADRIELNAALALGGLTPSLGTLLEVKQAVPIPVAVMLRPRPAGFAYSDADFTVMRRDLDLLLRHGADAVAFGILREDGIIDEQRCRLLRAQMGKVQAVFHRAFDVVPDPFEALEQLVSLGFKRVLTSGQQPTALEGGDLIAQLIVRAAGRMEVLPGGGVNRQTVRDLIQQTGCTQVHASLRHFRIDPSTRARPNVCFGAAGQTEDRFDATDPEAVAELRRLLDA
jgi:copper homeostasis protein